MSVPLFILLFIALVVSVVFWHEIREIDRAHRGTLPTNHSRYRPYDWSKVK